MSSLVLFLDTKNSSASYLAACFSNSIAADIDAFAGGLGFYAPDQTVLGIISDMGFSSDVSFVELQVASGMRFDLIVSIGEETRLNCPVFPGAPPVVHWNIEFPLDSESLRSFSGTLHRMIVDLFSQGYFGAFLRQRDNYNNILDSLNEGIMAHDISRKVFYFSKGAEKLTGLLKSDVLGKDCHELFVPHFCNDNCAFCEVGCLERLPQISYSSFFYDSDGTRREVAITRTPLRDADGRVVGAVAAINDITRIRQLEVKLGEADQFRGIIGQDHKILAIFDLIRDLAQSDFPVIVTGESGTGKELVAEAIHRESNQRDHLFVPINCGALPEGTLESELFGHVKGAFTGAIRDKKGRFELAHQGTLFLDEVAELSLAMQVKLLRVLQEGTFEPVGSESTKKVKVRVISATNRNIRDMVSKGTFREDLYYRLAVVPIELPPLRERRNDILLLAKHFLDKTAAKLGRSEIFFSDSALSILLESNWPGNIRQLQNAIQYALIKCRGAVILPDHLPPELQNQPFSMGLQFQLPGKAGRKPKLTSEIVGKALLKAGGNKAKAARMLGVGRATLYNFINLHKELLSEVGS